MYLENSPCSTRADKTMKDVLSTLYTATSHVRAVTFACVLPIGQLSDLTEAACAAYITYYVTDFCS